MQIDYAQDLNDKVMVVTGGGGVLCSVLAEAAAACGAKVALIDHGSGSTKPVVDAIVSAGGTARTYVADVLDASALERAKGEVESSLGPVDILLNGAGGNNPRANTDDEHLAPEDVDRVRTFYDLGKDDIESVFELNLMGTLIPSQVLTKDMVGRDGCSVINMSSMNAFTPLTKIPAYSGAKAAVTNFTQWLATYLAEVGIRVNAIAPGFFSTKQNKTLLFNEDGTPTARTAKIIAGTPMARFGVPDDLVGAFLFLADPKASGFVTGVTIPVDGGFSAYSGV